MNAHANAVSRCRMSPRELIEAPKEPMIIPTSCLLSFYGDTSPSLYEFAGLCKSSSKEQRKERAESRTVRHDAPYCISPAVETNLMSNQFARRGATLIINYFPRSASDHLLCFTFDEWTKTPASVKRCRVIRDEGLYGFFEFQSPHLANLILEGCRNGSLIMIGETAHLKKTKKWYLHASRCRSSRVFFER